MKPFFALSVIAMLAACVPSDPGITGTPDSNVLRLSTGMDRATVDQIIGASQETHRLGTGETCVSYLYDEVIAPKFVHAVFDGDTLVRASDGHAVTCSGA